MKVKYFVPNIITSGNLLCGVLAIIYAGRGDLSIAAMFIGIAAILDFLDGFAARLLKATSEFGKQMDSLADVITFGVAPAVLFHYLCELSGDHWYNFIALFIAVFAAIRLAIFNIDDAQKNEFRGVPTPAIAILIASFPYIYEYDILNISWIFGKVWFIMVFPLLVSYLMVARFSLFSLKIKNFKWRDNKLVFGFILLAIALIAIFQFTAVPIIIATYILLSLFRNFAAK
jgi:CDP-diacylglycerol---serine O-phosphatidyltransferase